MSGCYKRVPHFLAAVFLFMSSAATATTSPTVIEDYNDIAGRMEPSALHSDLFGDKVNLSNGATEFDATDVSVTTNNQLPLTLGRKLVVNNQTNYGGVNNPTSEIFGRFWQVDVPFMRGTFETIGWVGGNQSQPTQRCTGGGFSPPGIYGIGPYHSIYYDPGEYSKGVTINVPGQGEEELLNFSGSPPVPADGRTYYGTTASRWRVACLPNLVNGAGEGFVVVLPNGTKYYFDWIASRSAPGIVDTYCSSVDQNCYTGVSVYRSEVFLYATRVEDRFGNSVTYQYDPSNPHRLQNINSSDGASIALTYNALGKISTVSSGGRTWTYAYTGDASTATLSYLILPDTSRWTYQYNNLYNVTYSYAKTLWAGCSVNVGTMKSSATPGVGESASVVVTHPSGAIGEFLFRKIIHGTNRTSGSCTLNPSGSGYPYPLEPELFGVPKAFQIASLYSKKITGPGLAAQTWTYTYAPTWSYTQECTSSCASTSQTAVTDPRGIITTYVYGNDYSNNFGQLLSASVQQGATTYKTLSNSYITTAQGQSFPDAVGIAYNWRLNQFSNKYRPLQSSVVTQDGVTFNSVTNAFDLFARPLSVVASSSLGYTRTSDTVYSDNYQVWVLDQVAKTTVDGIVAAETYYDLTTALPLWSKAFGKLQQTLTYNLAVGPEAGTLKTIKLKHN